MTGKPWVQWQQGFEDYECAVSGIRSIGEDGVVSYAGSKKEKRLVRIAAKRLARRTKEVIPVAIDVGVDEASLLAFQEHLASCIQLVGVVPDIAENLTVSEPARIAVRQIELRSERATSTTQGPPDEKLLLIADRAFCKDALRLLAETHSRAPSAWHKLSAFNGCGGQRWSETAEAKKRGKGYDHARHALAEMVDAELIERAGAGKSRRGGFRITKKGLSALRQVTSPSDSLPGRR
ncbi:MAG: hypothetical protein KDC98_16325 [Planctomycetes bacterium]|nr:hypothetical protein [Planctomycetota bacterium]